MNRKKKIAFLGNYYPFYRNHLFEKLSNKYSIDILQDNYYKINLELVKKSKFYKVFSHKSIIKRVGLNFQPSGIRQILSGNYYAVFLPLRVSDLNTWFLLFLSKFVKCKVVLWGHIKNWGMFKRIVYKTMIQLSNSLVVYSEYQKELSISIGVDSRKVFVGFNTVDTERIVEVFNNLVETEITEYKKKIQVVNKKIVLFTGRLDLRKKIDLLLYAISIIKGDFPNIYCIIVGDGPCKASLIELTSQLGIESNVKFIDSLFDENELSKLFKISSVYALPGLAGLSVLHSYANKVPVIVSDSKNNGPEAELVEHLKTGYIFNDSDVNSLIEGIKYFLSSNIDKDKIVANSYNLIVKKYNSFMMSQGFIKAINY